MAKRGIALLLAALLLAAAPAALAADLSVLSDAVYDITRIEGGTSILTSLPVRDLALAHAHSLADHISYIYGEVIVTSGGRDGEVIRWCWNLCYRAREPLKVHSVTLTVGGRDFTLDVSEDATRKTLDDGTAEEWNYAFMGTDNARLWTALVLEGRIRERTGSFAGWTVPMVIHGEAEDVETALTTASLMDLYATYKAMSALGAADQLQRYHSAPLITGE